MTILVQEDGCDNLVDMTAFQFMLDTVEDLLLRLSQSLRFRNGFLLGSGGARPSGAALRRGPLHLIFLRRE